MQSVIDVNPSNFQKEVIDRSNDVPVVVDFWSPSCGPCMVLGPQLEELAAQGDGNWILAKVNTSDPQNQNLAMDFRIQGIPAVKAFKNGKVIDEFVGALPRPQVEAWLKKFLPNDLDTLSVAGREALEKGELETASQIFTALKEMKGDDPRGALGLAEIALANEDKPTALRLFESIDEWRIKEVKAWHARVWLLIEAFGKDISVYEKAIQDNPLDYDARYELAMLHATAKEYESALEQLIYIVSVNPTFREEAARLAAIRLFELIGVDTEMAMEWRKKLGRAMY